MFNKISIYNELDCSLKKEEETTYNTQQTKINDRNKYQSKRKNQK